MPITSALILEASLSSRETMAAPRNRKDKELIEQPHKKSKVAAEKVKIKRGAGQKSNEVLAKAQQALKATQAKVRHERQARAKAEKALAEAQDALAAAGLKAEHQTQMRRVSFVVRLTVYEHGQIGRTEIEHVESNRKQNFLSLDGERLVAFMKARISPTMISEPAILLEPYPEEVKAPILEHLKPKSNLIVSDVRVVDLGYPEFMTLILAGEEPFGIQARFQLQESDTQFLNANAASCEIELYADEVSGGESKRLTTYSAKLIQDGVEYTASVKVPGLQPGIYRLFALVILSEPIKVAGFYGKTIIHVT